MEAFVYCWTDKKTNMLYVGSHKGSTDDGYVCSSKYMLEEYNKRSEDFSRQIITNGSHKEMRILESAILKSVNAALNENFYNMHNNNGAYILKKHTQETKNKISNSEKGKIVSTQSKLKMKLSKIGEKNNRWGTKHSEKTKLKMSLSKKGKLFLEEHKTNLSAANKNKRWYHDPINKISTRCKENNQPNGWILGRK